MRTVVLQLPLLLAVANKIIAGIDSKTKLREVLFLTLIFCGFWLRSFSNYNDSTWMQKDRRNLIYIKPYLSFIGKSSFPIGGSEVITCLELGYGRQFKKGSLRPKQFDLRIGTIIPSLLLSSKNTSGFIVGSEYRVIVSKVNYHLSNYSFYYAVNFYYQRTRTKVSGEYDGYYLINNNRYDVFRQEIGLLPKVGVQLINKLTGIYSDIGVAVGGRFVTSRSKNKINQNAESGSEPYVNKEFDSGSAFAPKLSPFLVQLKFGYSF